MEVVSEAAGSDHGNGLPLLLPPRLLRPSAGSACGPFAAVEVDDEMEVEEEEEEEVAQDEYVVCVGPGLQVQPRRFLSFRLLIFFSSFPFSSSCSQRFLFSSLLWARPPPPLLPSPSLFSAARASLNQVQWWPHGRIPSPPLTPLPFLPSSFAPRTLCLPPPAAPKSGREGNEIPSSSLV